MTQSIREKAKVRQDREGSRLTEDDLARANLGRRGKVGKDDAVPTTEASLEQTPPEVDPGHPA